MKGSALPYFILAILLVAIAVYLVDPTLNIGALSSNFSHVVANAPVISTTAVPYNNSANSTQLEYYALSLINHDRQQYGLDNVTLSPEPSAQQHAQSMLAYNYFSHWDIYGLKPYMRYTLLGGTGASSENVAYQYSSSCDLLGICSGGINPGKSIQSMEYSMMYNDSICCNNGHRDNILNPNHNQVSIGIAYNSTTIYFVEDFIDNYIDWTNGPGFSNGEVYLQGTLQSGYSINQVEVSYDTPLQSMSKAQLDNTTDYGYGPQVAGVVKNSLYYYPNLTTIVADQYNINGNQFTINFNLQSTIGKYGAGEYTVVIYLNSPGQSSFVGSTYTIFINSQGQQYTPSNV